MTERPVIARSSLLPAASLSGNDGGHFKYPSKDDCPARDQHTQMPRDYRAWHEKAREMRDTHRQVRCPVCGYWAIWTPKAAE